jgi:NADH dehydrogenase [ubiquinone] 1 alpha subcomplex assembly factor 6
VRDDAADEVASFAGTGIGLTTAVRGTPIRLTHGECPIPYSLLDPQFPRDKLLDAVYGENSLSEKDAKHFQEAVQTFAMTATSYLSEARERQSQIPKHARTALLPVVPALHYLSRLEKAKYDVLNPALSEPDRMRLLLMLGRTWMAGIF